MKVYEASLRYKTVGEIRELPLEDSQIAGEYIRRATEEQPEFDPTVECVSVVLLNQKHYPQGLVTVSKGSATSSIVHPREVFKPAILAGSSAIILTHNHPSGLPEPSVADHAITKKIREASEQLDMRMLDHIIIGDYDYSFAESGTL